MGPSWKKEYISCYMSNHDGVLLCTERGLAAQDVIRWYGGRAHAPGSRSGASYQNLSSVVYKA